MCRRIDCPECGCPTYAGCGAHVEQVLAGVERLNGAARGAGIGVEILPGHEARISVELVDRYRDGRLLTLNGTRWLLV